MIEAATELDGLFGLGFCHAQDRAGQLEVLLRVGRGTVAELAGTEAVPVDRVSRRVGFRHAANLQWPNLAPHARAALDAYVRGINAGYAVGLTKRPHDLAALRIDPTPWEPQDVLAYTKLQCWFMTSNWDSELARLRILLADGPDALKALDPVQFDNAGLTYDAPATGNAGHWLSALAGLEADVAALMEVLPRGAGSNSWLVTPGRSATGRPIIANDPHLGAQVPAPWYLVSIRTPGWAVAGASFVGGPAIPCGHNGTAAWGVTAGLSDNTDLFLEEVRQETGGWKYRQGDAWLPCGIRREVIRVKKGEQVTEEVLSTPRGPIISPVIIDTPEALSLRAVWLDPLPLDGWLSAMKATTFADFRHCFRAWPGFPMNIVYGDTSGKTGWQFVGQLPIRKRGNGTIPMAGWDDRNGWATNLLPFEDMPAIEDPAAGFLATANNRPRREEDGPFLGADWLDRFRHQVIVEELEAREKLDLAACTTVQMCVRSIPWREVRETVLAVKDDRPAVREALGLLEKWDGEVTAESSAASVFEVFAGAMAVKLAKAKAPKSWEWAVGRGPTALNDVGFIGFRRLGHLICLLNQQPAGWFASGWPAAMADALDEAIHELQLAGGMEYAWSEVRPLVLKHVLMGLGPLKKAFDLGPIHFGGDEHTPCHASVAPLDPLGPVKSLPNLRAVMDVGNWPACRFGLAGGQSGNPFSPHYADLFDLWQQGEGVPIAFALDEMTAATVTVLRLLPMK